jgi:hypothetical protein
MLPEIEAKRSDVMALCKRLGVKRLEVFGSAATESFRDEGSDLDFLVEFTTTESGTHYADRYFDLRESLEALFNRPIDLVASSAIRNPYFQEAVNRTRTLLYAA